MCPKDVHVEGIVNNVDPDQTAPLIWVYTVCPDLSVRKLRTITVYCVVTREAFCVDSAFLVLKKKQHVYQIRQHQHLGLPMKTTRQIHKCPGPQGKDKKGSYTPRK